MKYIVSYNTRFGAISAESKRSQDLIEAYFELKKLAAKIEKSPKAPAKGKDREGRGETTEILSVLESKLLATNFFSEPRTTGETRDKLNKISQKEFTSRKVSQALGILRDKRLLRRTGHRNFFKYSMR